MVAPNATIQTQRGCASTYILHVTRCMLRKEKSIETMEKSIVNMENLMKTGKSMSALGKSMNTMEKSSKTMEKSMSSANGKFQLQNSAKYRFFPQNKV